MKTKKREGERKTKREGKKREGREENKKRRKKKEEKKNFFLPFYKKLYTYTDIKCWVIFKN